MRPTPKLSERTSTIRSPSTEILILNRQKKYSVRADSIRKMAEEVLAHFKLGHRSLSLVLVGRNRIRTLNTRYRGISQSTDVLSFGDCGIPGHLGDIVISLPNADHNARVEQHSLQKEIGWLILHGILHLAGYDHERDRGEMSRLERRLRNMSCFK